MKLFILKLTATFLLLLFLSCNVGRPEIVEVTDFKLVGYNPFNNKLTVQFSPVINNPNGIPFWINHVETEIYFDDKHFGTASSDKDIAIKANGESKFNMSQEMEIEKFIQQAKTLMGMDSCMVEMRSKYTFKAKDFEVTIPYSEKSYIYPKRDIRSLLFGG
ncbi:MAG: LEA type 2 family protein [Calditrichota bacterium]